MDDPRNLISKRIEIPVHYNLWMQGARHGTVVSFHHGKQGSSDFYKVKMDHPQVKKQLKLWRLDWEYINII
jgi:hypothetical protein